MARAARAARAAAPVSALVPYAWLIFGALVAFLIVDAAYLARVILRSETESECE